MEKIKTWRAKGEREREREIQRERERDTEREREGEREREREREKCIGGDRGKMKPNGCGKEKSLIICFTVFYGKFVKKIINHCFEFSYRT